MTKKTVTEEMEDLQTVVLTRVVRVGEVKLDPYGEGAWEVSLLEQMARYTHDAYQRNEPVWGEYRAEGPNGTLEVTLTPKV